MSAQAHELQQLISFFSLSESSTNVVAKSSQVHPRPMFEGTADSPITQKSSMESSPAIDHNEAAISSSKGPDESQFERF